MSKPVTGAATTLSSGPEGSGDAMIAELRGHNFLGSPQSMGYLSNPLLRP